VPAPVLITRREAARRLNVSERTVRRWGAAGWLAEVRLSPHTVRVTADSVARHMQRGYPARDKAA
jgi:excisionase family DNA binding protein